MMPIHGPFMKSIGPKLRQIAAFALIAGLILLPWILYFWSMKP